jgi:sodium transport system permease protein
MKTLWTVMLKELRDLFRDRRTVAVALLMGPLLIPVMILGAGSLVQKRISTQMQSALEVPVVGAEHAPNLVAWLGSKNLTVIDPPADPEARVLDETYRVILRVPEGFGEAWRGSQPATIELLYDSTRQDSQIPLTRVTRALNEYGQSVGALRLLARGVSPGVAAPLQVSPLDLSTPEARGGQVVGSILAYLLILSGFLGGAYLVVDVTAGERERQSLEPLLATPGSRGAIMSGKIAAACAFGMLTLLLMLLAFGVSMQFGPAAALRLDASWLSVAKLLLVLLPMVMLGTTLLTLISASVKSVKEAQSYMSILMLLPMLPTIMLMINPVKTATWMLATPFLAQNQLILRVTRGEAITAMEWAIYLGAGVGLSMLVWLAASRLYHREKLAISG